MAFGDLFSTGTPAKDEALPLLPHEQAAATARTAGATGLQEALTPRLGQIGQSAAAGLEAQPQALRDLAASFFPTAQPTTPQAAVEAVLPGVAAPFERRFQEQSLPALQAAFQAMGAGRSGQGGAQAEQLFRRQVSDPVAEALSRTAVQQDQFNRQQAFRASQEQLGMLTPNTQQLLQGAGYLTGMPSPQQQILRTGAQGPGAATEALIGALVSGKGGGVVGNLISNAIGGKGGASAAGTALNAAIRSGVGGAGQWLRENLGIGMGTGEFVDTEESGGAELFGLDDADIEGGKLAPLEEARLRDYNLYQFDEELDEGMRTGTLYDTPDYGENVADSPAFNYSDIVSGRDIFTPTTERDWARWDQEEDAFTPI